MEVNRESIDKILEKVTSTTKTAIKRSGEAYEITKLRILINTDKTKIKELKLQIGEIMYDAYSGVNSDGDEIETLCKAVDELYEEIEEKEVKIAELRNLKRCPMCGANNEKDSSFCKKCAADLSGEVAEEE